jgi:hypothetical protein
MLYQIGTFLIVASLAYALADTLFPQVNVRRIGGINFASVGRLRLSYCVARKAETPRQRIARRLASIGAR